MQLAQEWRQIYALLSVGEREAALHNQMLPSLMVEEMEAEAERAEAPHPLPVRVDGQALSDHYASQPIAPPLEHPSTYPGWIERAGRRAGDRKPAMPAEAPPQNNVGPCAVGACPVGADFSPPSPQPVAASRSVGTAPASANPSAVVGVSRSFETAPVSDSRIPPQPSTEIPVELSAIPVTDNGRGPEERIQDSA